MLSPKDAAVSRFAEEGSAAAYELRTMHRAGCGSRQPGHERRPRGMASGHSPSSVDKSRIGASAPSAVSVCPARRWCRRTRRTPQELRNGSASGTQVRPEDSAFLACARTAATEAWKLS
jgi:hypothetical protein